MKNILFFTFLLALGGCTNFFTIKPAQLSGVEVSEEKAAEIVSSLHGRAQKLTSLKALARIEVIYRDRNSSLRYGLILQRPDLMRIEGLPLNGTYSLSVLTSHAGQLQLIDHTKKHVTFAPLTKSALEALIQIPADPNTLLDYLAGYAPLRSMDYAKADFSVYRDESINRYHIVDRQSGNYWQARIGDLKLKRAQFRTTSSAAPYLELNYSYDDSAKLDQIVFLIPEKDLKIKLQYQVLQENQEIRSGMFEPQAPAGYELKALVLD